MRYEIDDRYAAFTSWRAEHFIDAAVGDIQSRPVAARVESVRPETGLDEADLGEPATGDEKHTVRLHVGDKENLAVGRDTDVLGHAAFGKGDIAADLVLYEIDLRQFALKFAGEDGEAAIDGEIGVINPSTARHL